MIKTLIDPDPREAFKQGALLGAGWMVAECCNLLDTGRDPRKEDLAKITEDLIKDLIIPSNVIQANFNKEG